MASRQEDTGCSRSFLSMKVVREGIEYPVGQYSSIIPVRWTATRAPVERWRSYHYRCKMPFMDGSLIKLVRDELQNKIIIISGWMILLTYQQAFMEWINIF